MIARATAALLSAVAFVGLSASVSVAEVTGTVKLDGKAPEMKPLDMSGVKECAAQHPDPVMEETIVAGEKGELQNVIVSIKPDEGQTLPGDAPSEPAVLDQIGCIYTPHVVALMVGQALVVKNDDPFLHNVHSLAEENPAFNQAQPNKDQEGLKITNLKSPEVFRVKCDVHPWMSAYVGVFEHPYFAVTDEEGKFSFKADQLPDGEYTLTAWHEKLGKQEKKVKIEGGKAKADLSFKAESARAPEVRTIMLASAKSAAEGEKECGSCCDAAGKDKVVKSPTTKPAEKTAEKTAGAQARLD